MPMASVVRACCIIRYKLVSCTTVLSCQADDPCCSSATMRDRRLRQSLLALLTDILGTSLSRRRGQQPSTSARPLPKLRGLWSVPAISIASCRTIGESVNSRGSGPCGLTAECPLLAISRHFQDSVILSAYSQEWTLQALGRMRATTRASHLAHACARTGTIDSSPLAFTGARSGWPPRIRPVGLFGCCCL